MKIRNVNFLAAVILSVLFVTACTEEEIVEPVSTNITDEVSDDAKTSLNGRRGSSCTTLSYSTFPFTFTPDSIQMVQNHFAGSYLNVYVTTSEDWTASIDGDWLFVLGPAGSDSGSGNGNFLLMAPGQISCDYRSATITIDAGCSGTESFIVFQDAAPGQPCI